MKVRLTFTLDVDVPTKDVDEAEDLARVKADAVIIQTLEATGYRMKYRESAFSITPALDQFLDELKDIMLQ